METITLNEIMISFIKSIDSVSYLLKDHHRQVAVAAYQLGLACNLPKDRLKQLVLAASLHDIGALTVAERDDLIQMDVQNPHPHAILGSLMLEPFHYFKDISKIIRYHHIYWNDGTAADAISDEIPFESYLLHLADRVEILTDRSIWILDQVDILRDQIINLKGSVFHPEAVKAFIDISSADRFWLEIEHISMDELLSSVLSDENEPTFLDMDMLEELAYTLSRMIDFRSEFTATHSYGVAMVAYEIAHLYGLSLDRCRKIRVAGYLHDIGKLAIATEIVEKHTRLSPSEFNQMKAHAYYTNLILRNIKGLEDICDWASVHHEKYDGSGYPYHLKGPKLSIEMDIIAYADIFTALTENRPYRSGKDNQTVLQMIRDEVAPQLGEEIYRIIEQHVEELNEIRHMSQTKAMREYQRTMFNVKVGMV